MQTYVYYHKYKLTKYLVSDIMLLIECETYLKTRKKRFLPETNIEDLSR